MKPSSELNVGDRVCAPSREAFPAGTIVSLLEQGFVLVRWDGDVLETADRSELEKL